MLVEADRDRETVGDTPREVCLRGAPHEILLLRAVDAAPARDKRERPGNRIGGDGNDLKDIAELHRIAGRSGIKAHGIEEGLQVVVTVLAARHHLQPDVYLGIDKFNHKNFITSYLQLLTYYFSSNPHSWPLRIIGTPSFIQRGIGSSLR